MGYGFLMSETRISDWVFFINGLLRTTGHVFFYCWHENCWGQFKKLKLHVDIQCKH